MDPTAAAAAGGGGAPPPDQQPPPKAAPEHLNAALQQQLNLDAVKARAEGLIKSITRILADFDAFARSGATPKWQDVLGQYSMVNMELFTIAEEIKKVSRAFVVYPKAVNAENAEILPVMLSSKLLPEMEAEDNAKREQLLHGITSLPVTTQIEKLKARIDMIGAACDTAEKIIADARKTWGLGSRQGQTVLPTLDKVQAAKIQEQENLLRAAYNSGEGLRLPADQRHLPSSLPSHLVDQYTPADGAPNFNDTSGAFPKNTASFSSNNVNTQGAMAQAPGGQLTGRPVPSPSGVSGAASFDNATTPPLPYANSPRSGTNITNTPSPQQQTQQQQQRQKMMQMPQHQQQLLAQQQLRQTSTTGILGQNSISQLHDFQGQAQQKFQQVTNMSAAMQSQSMQRMQFQSSGHTQRTHPSQILNDQMFAMGASNPASLVAMQQQQQQQQQQHGTQGGYGNMQMNTQNLQQGLGTLPNTSQNPNFQQQRQQNQQ